MQKITTWIWAIIGIIVVLFLLWWVSTKQTPGPGALTASTTPITVSDPSALPGLQTGNAPWAPETKNLSARLAADQLPELTMEGQVMHIHQHLDLYVHGQTVPVPPLIGINEAAGWLSQIHVHDTTGVIHVESPYKATFTLGEFFDVWGVKFTKDVLGGYIADGTQTLKVYVNGKLYEGDPRMLELASHQEIVIVYGTDAQVPSSIPSSYEFPAGY
jgi:hypothetical protein